MAASQPLTGVVLVDCAKANAAQGLNTAACQCGYDKDIAGFLNALKAAGEAMGIELQELKDLQAEQDHP